jgi:hypothetical protein
MEDWKYLKKLQLTERHGILKGAVIITVLALLVGLIAWAVKCCLCKTGKCRCTVCNCIECECNDCDCNEDDFEDDEAL